jgi:hypothetical protein
LKYMPGCDKTCNKHSEDFIKNNPMALDSRDSLVNWTSEFQNSQRPNSSDTSNSNASHAVATINDSTAGIASADDIVEGEPKPSVEKDGVIEANHSRTSPATGDEITKALKKSKEAKKALFLALCRQHNVREPTGFRFEVCPSNSSTSCIVYDERDIASATPYLNPYSDSDKQTIHEFDHYRELVTKGKISSEAQAETFAYETIQKSYPTSISSEQQYKQDQSPEPLPPANKIQDPNDKSQVQDQPETQKTEQSGYSEVAEAWDKPPSTYAKNASQEKQSHQSQPPATPVEQSSMLDESTPDIADVALIKSTSAQPKKKLSKWEKTIEDIVGNSSIAVGSIDDSLEGDTSAGYADRFPNYARAVRESEMAKKDAEIGKKLNEGFISYLDPVYQFPAKALGIKPGQMNLAHTPNIIMNVVQTLIESNTTPIGSGLFAFLTGISLFVAGYLGKSSISFRDQLALQNISAAFLWRTLQYINPKYEMKKDLKKMYSKIQDGDFRLSDSFIETPGMWKKKQNKMKNAWTNMPHYLGKDEKGRPAFIIPAPAAFATMSSSGAPLSGGTGATSEYSMPVHQGGLIGGLNVAGPTQDSSQEPTYNLGGGYYDIGQPGDEWSLPPYEPMAGSIGPVDPDVMRNVQMVG